MPHIDIDDLKIYYESHGEGKPLILIAGYACDVTLWSTILEPLAQRFRVLIFDNRGAGRTEAPEGAYTLETMADDVIKLAEHLELEHYAVLGHSMGGCIAQYVAYKQPERVSNLVLSNTNAFFTHSIAMTFRFFYELRSLGVAKELLIKGIMPWLYSENFLSHESHIKAVIEEEQKDPYAQTLAGQQGQVEALLQFDSREWCGSIKAPTLIIAGEKDLPSPPAEAEYLNERLINSELVIIPNVAHLPFIENPELYVDIVLQFLTCGSDKA